MTSLELRELEQDESRNVVQTTSSPNGHEGQQEFSLPPVDGGKDAWTFLAAAFMVETLVWGMSKLKSPTHHILLTHF